MPSLMHGDTASLPRQPRFPLLALAPSVLFLLAFLPYPLRFPASARPAFYADDFFYYVVIAQNLVAHGVSSFDGITITNGYHPLWMLIIAVIVALTGGTGAAFFNSLLAVTFAASLVSVWLVARLLYRWRTAPLLILACTLIFAVAYSAIAATGMEIIIAIPLILAFVTEADTAATRIFRPLRLGLIASACILARVDSLMLVAMVLLAALPRRPVIARQTRPLFWLACGLLPAGLYFLSNMAIFGMALPISSAAKALKQGWFFNTHALFMAFTPGDFDLVEIMVIMLPAWCVLAGAMAGVALWRGHSPRARIRTALLAFPPLLYALLAVHSDWWLWRWYLYPIVTAAPFALAWGGQTLFSLARQAATVLVAAPAILFGVLAAMLDLFGHYAHTAPHGNAIYSTALALQPFAATHPGRYAMGDRSGVTAFLIKQPVLQVEGIVGDRAMLAAIAAKTDLRKLLAANQVDYYVSVRMEHDGSCWDSVEPKLGQAGPLSPTMQGRFCSDPVFTFTDYEGTVTRVMALHGKPGA